MASAGDLPAENDEVTIVAVEYSGNNITKARLLNQQLYFVTPATVSGAALAESVQSIKDLGLFETVTPKLRAADNGYVLRIEVEEKFYVIPLPRLGLNSDGETSYGASVEWDNVAGLNQRLKLVWERKQLREEGLGEREVFRFDYDYPRIGGSLWNVGLFTSYSEIPVDETPENGGREYIEQEERYGISIGRQLFSRGQTRGWFVETSLFYLVEDNRPHDRVPELRGGSTWVTSLGARYENRRLNTYTEEGVQFSTELEVSLPGLGADYSYNRLRSNWRLVKPGFKPNQFHSVIYRAGLGIYNGGIPEAVGFSNASSNLRGLTKGELEGNALLHATVEYLLPITQKAPSWRYGGFVDAAIFADDYTNLIGSDISYSVGLALVWRPRKLVKVELRAEYGYNPPEETGKAGGGIDRF